MKQKQLAYLLAALMVATAIIYFVAAVEESSEGQEEEASEQALAADIDGDSDESSDVAGQTGEESELENAIAAQAQTSFFAVTGAAYAAVGGWMLKDKGRTKAPYIVAIVGSISIIALYIASRSVNLPIVGLQDDVGTIDVASKVLQVGIIAVAAWVMSSNKAFKAIPSRQDTR